MFMASCRAAVPVGPDASIDADLEMMMATSLFRTRTALCQSVFDDLFTQVMDYVPQVTARSLPKDAELFEVQHKLQALAKLYKDQLEICYEE